MKLNYSKLLNRKPIITDLKLIKDFIKGKRILVTGGAGSIGSEIVRQLVNFNASTVTVFDNAEASMFHLEQEISRSNPNSHIKYVIGDVRDKYRLEEVFDSFKPNIVFHAAAYKHVPMMEANPVEAIKTNVLGTMNVSNISYMNEVEKFVMVSTDKAVNPTNVMGATKRIAELYTQFLETKSATKFIVTRFGNVLGSEGSVIPTFVKQIERGGPVSVTHKEVIRYFMTIPEACQLVLQASVLGNGGEVFLFDMGEPVSINDLAKNLIKHFKSNAEIEYIGLRPGEKLYEELLCDGENMIPTEDENIMKLNHEEYDFKTLIPKIEKLSKVRVNDFYKIIVLMTSIVPQFKRESND
jgi:FlaA1/EpsC-like NDP-sugar epimerase